MVAASRPREAKGPRNGTFGQVGIGELHSGVGGESWVANGQLREDDRRVVERN